jgi:hypothetical protein
LPSFEELWRLSARYRRVSRELEPLLRELHAAFPDARATRETLERLLQFLAGAGRTDANCTTTYYFATATEPLWEHLEGELRAILDDMSGTLQDSIHAANIARTFEATPEQLLERLRKVM